MKLICLIGLLLLVGCDLEMEETTENITEEINIEAEQQREQQNQKVVDKESLCRERVKSIIPKNITLEVHSNMPSNIFYIPFDSIYGGQCNIIRGTLVGENVNKYYGKCQIRFGSGKYITETGFIMPAISFEIDVLADNLIYIPESNRYDDEVYATLNDFKIEKFGWISCSGADSFLYTDFCINDCKKFNKTYKNLFFDSNGTLNCRCN